MQSLATARRSVEADARTPPFRLRTFSPRIFWGGKETLASQTAVNPGLGCFRKERGCPPRRLSDPHAAPLIHRRARTHLSVAYDRRLAACVRSRSRGTFHLSLRGKRDHKQLSSCVLTQTQLSISNASSQRNVRIMASTEHVEEYASALAELTVNSKPIISSLTILAQEIGSYDAAAAASIAGLVETHIRTVRDAQRCKLLIFNNASLSFNRVFGREGEVPGASFSSFRVKCKDKCKPEKKQKHQTSQNASSRNRKRCIDNCRMCSFQTLYCVIIQSSSPELSA